MPAKGKSVCFRGTPSLSGKHEFGAYHEEAECAC